MPQRGILVWTPQRYCVIVWRYVVPRLESSAPPIPVFCSVTTCPLVRWLCPLEQKMMVGRWKAQMMTVQMTIEYVCSQSYLRNPWARNGRWCTKPILRFRATGCTKLVRLCLFNWSPMLQLTSERVSWMPIPWSPRSRASTLPVSMTRGITLAAINIAMNNDAMGSNPVQPYSWIRSVDTMTPTDPSVSWYRYRQSKNTASR